MKAVTIATLSCACDACGHGSGGCVTYPDGKIPIGTINDRADAYKWVLMGVADSADEECRQRVNITPKQLKAVKHAAKRTALGIIPEDFEAYDSGEMRGYKKDGSFIPGPNATVSDGGIILDDRYDDD